MSEKQDRVTQTIDQLISNLPEAVIKLKAGGLTSLARQIQNDLDNLVYWDNRGGLVTKERSEMWRKQASMYKELHGKDTNRLGHLAAQNIKRAKFKPDGCTCVDEPGDEYYCSVHGGEGCWIDLKVKSGMLIEKLGDWIVGQNNDVKRSAASAFGDELKTLGKTLSKVTDGNRDRDQCNCDQINWVKGPHHQDDSPNWEQSRIEHHLKTWPPYFEEIATGSKTFDLRENDREFSEGDILVFEEWDPQTKLYTGRVIKMKVGFMIQGEWGLSATTCAMSLLKVEADE